MSWISSEVIEKVGKVICNILVDTRSHLVRAYVNQIQFIDDIDDKKNFYHLRY